MLNVDRIAPENKTFRDKMRKFSVAFSKLFRNFLIFTRKEMKEKESEILREKKFRKTAKWEIS